MSDFVDNDHTQISRAGTINCSLPLLKSEMVGAVTKISLDLKELSIDTRVVMQNLEAMPTLPNCRYSGYQPLIAQFFTGWTGKHTKHTQSHSSSLTVERFDEGPFAETSSIGKEAYQDCQVLKSAQKQNENKSNIHGHTEGEQGFVGIGAQFAGYEVMEGEYLTLLVG